MFRTNRASTLVHGETTPLQRWMSFRTLMYIFYLPRIMKLLVNWIEFLVHYLGFRNGSGSFHFRNGLCISDSEGTVAGTIAVVFIRKHYGELKNKSIVVDIGANVGVFSLFTASQSPNASIYSYEPIKSNYAILQNNIKNNGFLDRIKAYNKGVAAVPGQRRIYVSSSPSHSFTQSFASQESEIIECTTLENLIRDNNLSKIDVLKLNCEGAEYEILYSASKALEIVRDIRMEYHILEDEQHRIEPLTAYLVSIGFSITNINPYCKTDGFLWASRR
jgi:FkbM family methyltransferase